MLLRPIVTGRSSYNWSHLWQASHKLGPVEVAFTVKIDQLITIVGGHGLTTGDETGSNRQRMAGESRGSSAVFHSEQTAYSSKIL